jgi:hypothetical protein
MERKQVAGGEFPDLPVLNVDLPFDGEPVLLVRDGKPIGALVSLDDLRWLQGHEREAATGWTAWARRRAAERAG